MDCGIIANADTALASSNRLSWQLLEFVRISTRVPCLSLNPHLVVYLPFSSHCLLIRKDHKRIILNIFCTHLWKINSNHQNYTHVYHIDPIQQMFRHFYHFRLKISPFCCTFCFLSISIRLLIVLVEQESLIFEFQHHPLFLYFSQWIYWTIKFSFFF